MANFLEKFGDKLHGNVPGVAPFIETDPIAMLKKLLGGEMKAWPQITGISELYRKYMMGALESEIPGFADILKQGGADTQALLGEALPLIQGQIPQDVMNQVLRSAAFSSLGSGTMGSGLSANLTARDLGNTSLGLMQQGAGMLGEGTNAAQRWQQIAMGTILPPTSNMYSPEWFTNFMAQQNAGKQAVNQQRLIAESMPDPGTVDRVNLGLGILGMFTGAGGMGGGLKATGAYQGMMGAGGAAGAMGGPSGMAAGMYGSGASGLYNPTLSNPSFYQNPGFGSNFMQTYNNPNAPSQGLGGMMGNWFGSLFNQSARPGGFQWGG